MPTKTVEFCNGVTKTYDLPDDKGSIEWRAWDRPLIVGIDLDGTLFRDGDNDYEWNGTGHFFPTDKRVKMLVTALSMLDDVWIVIWTCRKDRDEIAGTLNSREIPYDSINRHPFEPDTSRKMAMDINYDDSAFQCRADNQAEFLRQVLDLMDGRYCI